MAACRKVFWLSWLVPFLICSCSFAQIVGFPVATTPGVYLEIGGKVRCRELDERNELAGMKARMKASIDAGKKDKLVFVSLPKVLDQVRLLRQAGKEVPEELRFLSGLTRIQYVLVVPDEKDVLIAGPAEPWLVVHGESDCTQFVVGKQTGHPVLQLDDLLAGLRTAREGGGRMFGCGIFPSPDSLKIADDIAHRMASNTRAQRMAALADGLGPQDVKIFGTQNDTRFAYICVAADYELKRFALGIDHAPIAHLGNAIDNTRSAANKFWFEAKYDPILVSKDGDCFEIRGQRLGTAAGGFDFDKRGATHTATAWATQFSKNIPQLAIAVPLFAELQNVADEALLGNLLLHDRIAEKIGWNNAWIYDDSACPIAKVPVPKTCDTLVSYTNGSIVAGGVSLSLAPLVEENARQTDDKDLLVAVKKKSAP